MTRRKGPATLDNDSLRPEPLEYPVWGREYIDQRHADADG